MHKVVASHLLSGQLTYPQPLIHGVFNDMQVYKGAVFTNWGYGVPLLQLPFIAAFKLWNTSKTIPFFPDRTIFFFYLCLVNVFLLFAVVHWLKNKYKITHEGVLWPLATGIALSLFTFSLYWLTSYRFIVYEETVAYLVLFQFISLGAYLCAIDSPSMKWVLIAGLASGMGIVIRGTGLFYIFLWGGLFLFLRPKLKPLLFFIAGCLPFLVFWLVANHFKTGMWFSPGYENSLPYYSDQYLSVRFNNPCASGLGVFKYAAQYLSTLFLGVNVFAEYLNACHYYTEPLHNQTGTSALIPPVFTVFLTGILSYSFFKGGSRKQILLAILCIVLMALGLALKGFPFSARYAGDYWPILILLVFQALSSIERPVFLPLVLVSLVLVVASYYELTGPISLQTDSLQILKPRNLLACSTQLDPTPGATAIALPHSLSCPNTDGSHTSEFLFGQGMSWGADCKIIDTVTNHFLGIPKKEIGNYQLKIKAHGELPQEVGIYINNERHIAKLTGETYSLDFHIEQNQFHSPNLMIAIRWSESFQIPNAYLNSVEIL